MLACIFELLSAKVCLLQSVFAGEDSAQEANDTERSHCVEDGSHGLQICVQYRIQVHTSQFQRSKLWYKANRLSSVSQDNQ